MNCTIEVIAQLLHTEAISPIYSNNELDSKSLALGYVGSSPTSGTTT